MSDNAATDPRVFFVAERTFLAWIRTGLALMGFGFVVARFGLFLRELVLNQGAAAPRSSGASVVLGVCLVVTGVVVCLGSTLRHVRIIRSLQENKEIPIRPSRLAIALAMVGILAAFYLLLTR